MEQLIERVLLEHRRTVDALLPLVPQIAAAGRRLEECLRVGAKICWIGNGGSAADAQHLAAEVVGRFEIERRALPALALTVDTSVLTAVANDFGFERVFARQIEALCVPNDVVVALSTSGGSANVLAGVEAARAQGCYTLALAGGDGGELARVAESCITVPVQDTARVQEAHVLIGHMWCAYLEQAFSDEAGSASS